MHVSTTLQNSFRRALKAALALPKDVAAGIGKAYRTLRSYEEGSRNVTVASARALSRYLKGRARSMLKAADALDKAIGREEERDGKEAKAKK